MTPTENRLQVLANENLNISGSANLDAGLSDSDVSSMDAVAFVKLVGKEFNIEILPEDFAQITNLRGLAAYIDAHSG